ncbi:MAG: zinc ABC transporter substrate-binding protein [Candidatus Hinthialibacter antarcticus]|nr:zinc ABC transporter substrate-binding protein [Candidatus Hinthialibacter antarcticus]
MIQRLLILVTIISVCSCGGPVDDGRIKAVCTIAQVADVVRNVAGDRIEVVNMMGEGVDPHLYKASPADLGLLSRASVVFYNGLMLEGRMTEIFEKMQDGPKPVIAFGDSMDPGLLRSPKEFEGHHDPHIWMSVNMWADAVPTIVDALVKVDPEGEAIYRANGDVYQKKLADLHAWVKAQIATIPREQRVLITAHDAFGYFGDAYDIEVMGLQGISTVSEFGLQDLQRLIDIIVERNVKAVFVESSVPAKSIEALVAGCRGKGHEVVIGGELFSDAMGAAGTDEGTYVGMIRHNVNTMANSLK